jgi:glyoxylase-like metal-dependent hydrolase (beta-lactamase superfamily II)
MSDLPIANATGTADQPEASSARRTTSIRISRLGVVNAYLVVEDDGLTLIDTGLPGAQRRILARAGAIERPIVRIALTHAHSDHIGSLDALTTALPEVEVIISAREAPLLERDKRLRRGEPHGRVRGWFPGTATRPTRTVDDGDHVGSLRVIATPGHTPGHVSFFDTRDGTLYAGDVFTNRGGLATSAVVHWRFPIAGLATWSRQLELDSARRLSDLVPARLAPGHGPVLDAPAPAIQRAIAATANRA